MSILPISLADIEDILMGTNDVFNMTDLSITSEGQAYRRYRTPGAFIPPETMRKFTEKVLNESYITRGHGGYKNTLQNFMSRLDRHGSAITPLNSLNHGFTFITRPRLNMTDGNMRAHPLLNTLITNAKNSVPFMIRHQLDTRMSRGMPLRGVRNYQNYDSTSAGSGLIDIQNPFLVPLMNGLKGISGFPDFNLDTETTDGDFHSGDFTFVKGSDMHNRTSELSLEFRDVQGSIVMSIIYYWAVIMALQAKGVVIPYPDDEYAQRLNYTVSIYRFVTDTSRRNILWWMKATGCFPKSAPVGGLFNVNQGETTISSAMNFSVPFVANDIKYNLPSSILDFNALVKRYCPAIDTPAYTDVPRDDNTNFIGLPYIETTDIGMELKWKTSPYYQDVISDSTASWQEITDEVESIRAQELENISRALTPATEEV